MRTDLIIAGVGGQGSLMAGTLLGTAAVLYDNKKALQTQSYSSELRGGAAVTWVIVSDEPIVYPRVVLLSLAAVLYVTHSPSPPGNSPLSFPVEAGGHLDRRFRYGWGSSPKWIQAHPGPSNEHCQQGDRQQHCD